MTHMHTWAHMHDSHAHVGSHACMADRLEELGERRAGLLARAKVTEREREGLEGAKAAAEAYLGKEAKCADSKATILQLFIRDGQVNDTACTCGLCHVEHPSFSWRW